MPLQSQSSTGGLSSTPEGRSCCSHWSFSVALIHPLYYLLRIGVYDPIVVLGGSGRIPTVTRYVTPILDPYIGLVVWWPVLVAVALAGGMRRAWTRSLEPRSLREWAVVWAPFVLACTVLLAQAQVGQPESGGTFSMSRYAVWIAPFALFGLDRRLFRGWTSKGLVGAVTVLSVLISLHVARPSRLDNWYTVRPTFVADEVNDHAPWAWNPSPYVFMVREWRTFTTSGPVANEECTKLLAVAGAWPDSCPAPENVPLDCSESPYCYANRSGESFSFVPVTDKG